MTYEQQLSAYRSAFNNYNNAWHRYRLEKESYEYAYYQYSRLLIEEDLDINKPVEPNAPTLELPVRPVAPVEEYDFDNIDF